MRMPKDALLSLALLATIPIAQAQSFAFSSAATPASQVVAKLAKQTGLHLRTAEAISNRTLLVDVHGTTSAEVMTRIADVVGGEWQKDGDGFILASTSAMERKLRDQQLTFHGARIKGSLAKIAPKFGQEFTLNAAREYVNRTVRQTEKAFEESGKKRVPTEVYGDTSLNNPSGRALWSILTAMDPKALGAAAPDVRLVFATNPTSVQIPLPPSIQPILDRFVREETFLMQAVRESEAETDDPRRANVLKMDGLGSGQLGPGDPRRGLGKVELIVKNDSFDDLILELDITDRDGKSIGKVHRQIELDRSIPAFDAVEDPTPIAFSTTTRELAKQLANLTMPYATFGVVLPSKNDAGQEVNVPLLKLPDGSGTLPLSPQLKEIILHPREQDPMSFAPTEGLIAAAKSHQVNIVAWIPDEDFGFMMRAAAKPTTTIGTFLTECPRNWNLRVTEKGGWMVAAPLDPYKAAKGTVDRGAYEKVAARLEASSFLTLDEVAEYSLSRQSLPTPTDFDRQYLDHLNPSDNLNFANFGDWNLIRFYGSLDDHQRGSLATTPEIALRSLAPLQASLLATLIYNSNYGPYVGSLDDARGAQRYIFTKDLDRPERTDLLPSGVITAGFYRAVSVHSDGVFAENTATRAGMFMNADEMAAARLEDDVSDPWMKRIIKNAPVFDRYRPAKLDALDFGFNFGQGIVFHQYLRNASTLPGAGGDFGSMPEGYRRDVAAKLLDYRQAFKNYWSTVPKQNSQNAPP